ncbi:hypothetical protein EUU23_08210 [Sphingorhabdus sp. IMCC26285]|uniref:Uncharacterized protein n=1 Tax=Sphingorhabdus profundilacus TaxID=2509718 RepID=A0A6I4LVX3_9SPHN|nr:hypothetical protein [Sphingorhabdus profundilacus]MVZ97687.1 hypothetical protein [Sphingorhabdus profundilacus]
MRLSLDLVLMMGALLNGFGAVKLFASSFPKVDTQHRPDDYWQLRLFVAGTAMVFGLTYIYLYYNPVFVWPFLLFGAALKSWAFFLSLYLLIFGRLSKKAFIEFGLTNGVVATAFWIFLSTL